MMIPTIHLNGTSKERLLDAIQEAHAAIGEALQKLAETAPNGRDYYVQGPDALYRAAKEHDDRMSALRTVQGELQGLADGIDRQ